MDREKLIEAICRGMIDADPTMEGYHETHIDIKRPHAEAALSAIDSLGGYAPEGKWIAPDELTPKARELLLKHFNEVQWIDKGYRALRDHVKGK